MYYAFHLDINTSYLTDAYIVFTLKLESGSKITIFGLKMMVKSGLEKFILKIEIPPAWRNFKFFLEHFSPSFLGQKLYF